METREEKFKAYREEIKNNHHDETKDVLIQDDLENQQENYLKKNTLTMSIDQIIEAHDEYTIMFEKKELEAKLKKEKHEKNMANLKVVFKWIGIAVILLLIIVVLFVIILNSLGK